MNVKNAYSSTSGLDTGLSLLWIATSFLGIASVRPSDDRRLLLTGACIGLGPLGRLDLMVMTLVFLLALVAFAWPLSLRRIVRLAFATAAVPVAVVTSRSRVQQALAAAVLLWAVAAIQVTGPGYENKGPHDIDDEPQLHEAGAGRQNPVAVEDYAAWTLVKYGRAQKRAAERNKRRLHLFVLTDPGIRAPRPRETRTSHLGAGPVRRPRHTSSRFHSSRRCRRGSPGA